MNSQLTENSSLSVDSLIALVAKLQLSTTTLQSQVAAQSKVLTVKNGRIADLNLSIDRLAMALQASQSEVLAAMSLEKSTQTELLAQSERNQQVNIRLAERDTEIDLKAADITKLTILAAAAEIESQAAVAAAANDYAALKDSIEAAASKPAEPEAARSSASIDAEDLAAIPTE